MQGRLRLSALTQKAVTKVMEQGDKRKHFCLVEISRVFFFLLELLLAGGGCIAVWNVVLRKQPELVLLERRHITGTQQKTTNTWLPLLLLPCG